MAPLGIDKERTGHAGTTVTLFLVRG